jgi:hypothetical protein
MIDETPSTQSSAEPLDDPAQDDSQGTSRESTPRDDSPVNQRNERWENDLEADQMEDLLGQEAIEDRGSSADEIVDSSSDNS